MSIEEAAAAKYEAKIEQKIVEVLKAVLVTGDADISRETRFREDLTVDSLDFVELVMDLEEIFEMSISDEDAEKIQTVGQAVQYIKEQTATTPSTPEDER